MNDAPALRPATDEETIDSIGFGLRYDGRKRSHSGDDLMARITAKRILEHLKQSGFEVMKKPAATAPSTTKHHQR